ncbi:ABC transporter permease, partial [Dietzia sp. E1]|nr:ABC transporter permease [Dietzia sp. E1]
MTTTPVTRRPSSADHDDAATAPRSTDAAWRIVAGREIMVKLRDRNFIISTLTTIAIFVVAFGVSFLLGGDDGEKRIAVVSGDAVTIVEQTNARADAADGEDTDSSATAGAPTVRLGVEQVADPAAAEQAVRDGDVDAALLG